VDVIDRLPAPFGLVRYGVAPDHLKIKSVVRALSKILGNSRARFIGNVSLGDDVTMDHLRAAYDGVLIATGAPHARRLHIPGEELPGNYAAADLVSWYNGHPFSGVPYATPAESVAIVGAGNVSIDIARVLLKGGTGLTDTDAPDGVLDALDRHPPRDVHMIARRGAADVRFTPAELLELEKLGDVDLVVKQGDLTPPYATAARYDADRTFAARIDTFQRWADTEPSGAPKRVHFHFLRSPVEVLGTDAVTGLRLRHNAPDGTGRMAGSARTQDFPVQAVVRSIGYYGESVPGLPFDHARGLIPNEAGRVGDGIYVTGWIKRGPTGIIGSNKACAIETVAALLSDLTAADACHDVLELRALARSELINQLSKESEPHRRSVSWNGWIAIDAAEIELGSSRGRARTKISDSRELVDIAHRTS
jgi:ferredoxin--NADP+ reductase